MASLASRFCLFSFLLATDTQRLRRFLGGASGVWDKGFEASGTGDSVLVIASIFESGRTFVHARVGACVAIYVRLGAGWHVQPRRHKNFGDPMKIGTPGPHFHYDFGDPSVNWEPSV